MKGLKKNLKSMGIILISFIIFALAIYLISKMSCSQGVCVN